MSDGDVSVSDKEEEEEETRRNIKEKISSSPPRWQTSKHFYLQREAAGVVIDYFIVLHFLACSSKEGKS